jgi:hypothetical protein
LNQDGRRTTHQCFLSIRNAFFKIRKDHASSAVVAIEKFPLATNLKPSLRAIDDSLHLALAHALGNLEKHTCLRCNKEYGAGAHQIPTVVGKTLEKVLPKGGLLGLLQQYPTYFEVTLTGVQNRKDKPLYKFKISLDDPQPAVGGCSSSGASPALLPPPGRAPPQAPLGPPWWVSVPAVGGSPNVRPVVAWTVGDMVQYARKLDLSHLAKIIAENGIDGHILFALFGGGFENCRHDSPKPVPAFGGQPLAAG